MVDDAAEEIAEIVERWNREEISLVRQQLVSLARVGRTRVSIDDLWYHPQREDLVLNWLRSTFVVKEPFWGRMVIHLDRRKTQNAGD